TTGLTTRLRREMRRFRQALLPVAALLLAAPPAWAQVPRSPYRFVEENQAAGVSLGYMFTNEGTLDLGPESGALLGGRYTIRLSGPFNIEADAGYLSSGRTVQTTIGEEGELAPAG